MSIRLFSNAVMLTLDESDARFFRTDGDTNIKWDSDHHRLGIGTDTPESAIEVVGGEYLTQSGANGGFRSYGLGDHGSSARGEAYECVDFYHFGSYGGIRNLAGNGGTLRDFIIGLGVAAAAPDGMGLYVQSFGGYPVETISSGLSSDGLRIGTSGNFDQYYYKLGRNTGDGNLDLQPSQEYWSGFNFKDSYGNTSCLIQRGNVGVHTSAPTLSDGNGLHIGGKLLRIDTAKTPASASAAGNAGEICWDSDYLYVCIAANTWRRVAHATW